MITYFTDPFPEESMYSVFGRLYRDGDYISHGNFFQEVFGKQTKEASPLFISGISTLLSNLPPCHSYDAEYFIDRHTLLPSLRIFLPKNTYQDLYRRLVGEMTSGGLPGIGCAKLSYKSHEFLTFCPMCAESDDEVYGEAYFHRVHQFPGVFHCPIHNVNLLASKITWRGLYNNMFSTLDGNIGFTPTINTHTSQWVNEKLKKYAQQVHTLFLNPSKHCLGRILIERYKYLLKKRNLATYSGWIYWSRLRSEFDKYCDPQILELWGLNGYDKSINWLEYLLQDSNHTVRSPMEHFLLCDFLGVTFEELINLEPDQLFTGGPWSCQNIFCNRYLQDTINDYELGTDYRSRPSATFTCSHCYYRYRVIGPHSSADFSNVRKYVVEKGDLWINSVKEMWRDPNLSPPEIIKILGISPKSLCRIALNENLPFPMPGVKKNSNRIFIDEYLIFSRPSQSEKREEMRLRFLTLLKANPYATRKQLDNLDRHVLSWLRKDDRRNNTKWLEDKLPQALVPTAPPIKVNYQKRDERLANHIISRAEAAYAIEGYPKRVFRSFLIDGFEVSGKVIINQLHRLPRSSKLIEQFIESSHEFALRRLKWAESEFIKMGEVPNLTQLKMKAGLNSYSKIDDIQSELEDALVRLSQKDG